MTDNCKHKWRVLNQDINSETLKEEIEFHCDYCGEVRFFEVSQIFCKHRLALGLCPICI